MLRWLSHNIWNILLSIVLAVVVWVVAVNEANPNREDTFRGIPVTLVHQPPDTEVYAPSATSVAVTLSAPQSTWPDLGPGVISATLDLSDAAMGEGLYRVSVSVPEASRRLVRVVSVDPPSIGLTVEPRRTRLVPVEINLVGDLAIGFRASGTTARPAHVTVGGPASWVERVSAATSDFSVQGASASMSQTLPLKPVDADGQIVPNVVLDPDQTTVEVDVEQLAGFANLAVKAVLTGTQASGYRLAEVNVTPPNVTVIGGPDTLAAMPGFVETEPVDIGGAQSDIEKDVQLVLPPDVALVDQPSVRVSVKIEPVVSSLTVRSAPSFIGLPETLAARASPDTVEVILVGPLPVLEAIDVVNDVRVILDVTDLGLGTHQVTPRVEAPQGVTAQSILPSTVQVTIERAPRGTPNPSPTPAATPTKTP